MLQDFFKISNVDDVYWTLGIELCFYIIMFIFYQAKLLKHIEKIVIGWLIVSLFFCLKTYAAKGGLFSLQIIEPNYYASVSSVYYDFHQSAIMGVTNLFSPSIITQEFREIARKILVVYYAPLFIIGMMLYREKQYGFSKFRWLIIAICILSQRFAYSWIRSWEAAIIVACLVGIFFLAIKGYLSFINIKPLIFLGTISYSLYLIHQNVGYAIIKILYQYNDNPYINIMIAVIIVLILASLMTFLVEKPALHFLRNKYNKNP